MIAVSSLRMHETELSSMGFVGNQYVKEIKYFLTCKIVKASNILFS